MMSSIATWGDSRLGHRFWMATSPEPNSGCWLHAGSRKQIAMARHRAYVVLVRQVPARTGLRSRCGECCVNPEHSVTAPVTRESRGNSRRWHSKTDDEKRDISLRHRYGISVDTYNAMLKAQDGACAICRAEFGSDPRTRGHVDHDHETGAVRALLCLRCNPGIGNFRENAQFLRSAAEYIEKHKGTAP